MPTPNPPDPPGTPGDPDWDARLAYWRRRLGRVRLGAEPVEEQLARYRRVTWLLTAIPLGLALMFLGLFTAFGHTAIGAALALILLAPVVTIAWLDDLLLRHRARAYLRELHDRQPPGQLGPPGTP